jgi:hypothetical protein
MNDDLFSAHFLLRKMQEDEWGKWLHGILHQAGELIFRIPFKPLIVRGRSGEERQAVVSAS